VSIPIAKNPCFWLRAMPYLGLFLDHVSFSEVLFLFPFRYRFSFCLFCFFPSYILVSSGRWMYFFSLVESHFFLLGSLWRWFFWLFCDPLCFRFFWNVRRTGPCCPPLQLFSFSMRGWSMMFSPQPISLFFLLRARLLPVALDPSYP